jgi:hypothetical protein
MSTSISTSELPRDFWMIQNSLFREFNAMVRKRVSDDSSLLFQLDMAEATNGVALDALYRENAKLAIRLRDAFMGVAIDISSGECHLPDPYGESPDATRKARASLFANLVDILERWTPESTDIEQE